MYRHAIVRRPGRNFADGITTSALGMPDFDRALKQHHAYCKALNDCGISLTILEADPRYPDGCFVEDTAIITEHLAIITQPGHPARAGEQTALAEILVQHMPIDYISGDGRLDGGDILRADRHFYIGRSDRTNAEGARQLSAMLSMHGFTTSEIPVAAGLHLKSSVTYIGGNTLLVTPAFSQYFAAHRMINVGEEEYAANCVLVNDRILFAAGFPETRDKLMKEGYQIVELDMSEFRKMDGGLTCLSLLMFND